MNLLTAEEVAAKLKVHVNTVYKNREIPRVELAGGIVRWDEADVEAWIRSKITRKAKPEKRLRERPVSDFMRRSRSGGDAA